MDKGKIRIPATTANLGPGFDVLGLALDLWNEVDFELRTLNFELSLKHSGVGVQGEKGCALYCRL
jgi:homoserine kinase